MTKSFRKKTFGKGSGGIFDDFFAVSFACTPLSVGLNAEKEN
jgi:hypothetical protein